MHGQVPGQLQRYLRNSNSVAVVALAFFSEKKREHMHVPEFLKFDYVEMHDRTLWSGIVADHCKEKCEDHVSQALMRPNFLMNAVAHGRNAKSRVPSGNAPFVQS